MRIVKIINESRPNCEPIEALYCETFFLRFRGLMFRKSIQHHEGVLLVQGSESQANSSIHMLFMNFDIAAIWLNRQLQVVDVQLARKWRPAYFPSRPASFILEVHASLLNQFAAGDQLAIENL